MRVTSGRAARHGVMRLLLVLLLAPPAQAATVGFETDGGAIDEETGEQSIESSASVFVSDLPARSTT